MDEYYHIDAWIRNRSSISFINKKVVLEPPKYKYCKNCLSVASNIDKSCVHCSHGEFIVTEPHLMDKIVKRNSKIDSILI